MTKGRLHRTVRWCVTLALAGCAAVLVNGASLQSTAGYYTIDFWNEANGLSQSRTRGLVQGRDGYLWLGTDGGLVRFDGVKFTVYNVESGSLRDNEVFALKQDRDGALWVGTGGGGLTRYKDGHFTTYTSADGLPDDGIRDIDQDEAGDIWIATLNGLTRLSNGVFTTYTRRDGLVGNYAVKICAKLSQGIFVLAGNELHRFVDGRFVVEKGVIEDTDGRVVHLFAKSDGALWIGFENGMVKRFRDGVCTVIWPANKGRVRGASLYEDRSGGLWFGARDGVFKMMEGRMQPVVASSIAAQMGTVFCFCEDREGNLWLGMEGNGLARLRRTVLTRLTAEDGLPSDSTRSVFADREGRIWIGTTTGFACWEEGRMTAYTELDGKGLGVVTAFAEDSQGVVWIGVSGELLKCQEGRLARVPGWRRVMDIKTLYRDPMGRMWVGTDGDGLHCFADGRETRFTMQNGLASDNVRGIVCDRLGALWVATTNGGVSRYADGTFTTFTTADGLAGNRVSAVCEDDDGTLWFATRSGLSRYANGKFTTFRSEQGLFVNFVSNLLDDGRDSLWFGSSQGMFSVTKADFRAVAEGRAEKVRSHIYGMRDGLATPAFGAGLQSSVYRTADGLLFLSSLKGLVIVNPGSVARDRIEPPLVKIESTSINKRLVSPAPLLAVPLGSGEVEIHYTAPSYTAPEKIRFRYRLEGFDRDWVDAGTRRFAYYANLPPGKYSFLVTACNEDDVWNETGDSVAFALTPPFYRTYWFYALAVLALVGVIGAIYELRLLRLRAQERELQRKVSEAIAKVKVLSGLLPICSSCKKIRDDKGYWNQIEVYIREHSDTEFSHGLCPDCLKRLYPEYSDVVLSTIKPPSDGPDIGHRAEKGT